MNKSGRLGKQDRVVSEGSVAVVTGASSGIGQAIARELAGRGMYVYALARSLPDYFQDVNQHQGIGSGYIRPVRIDVNNEPGLKIVISKIIQAEGRLDCLVQAAGIGIAGSIEDTSSDEARLQMNTNFFGAMHALPPVVQQMRNQKRGLIVHVGSVAGFLPIPFQGYYSASKAALAAITLALGDEVRPWGIRCLLVQPGDTRTGFTQSRIMTAASAKSEYADRCGRSIAKMAADEMAGKHADTVARQIVRRMARRRPPLVFTPGAFYKLIIFLARLLPLRLIRGAVDLMYAR